MTYTRTSFTLFFVLFSAVFFGVTHIASAQQPFDAPREGRPGGAMRPAEARAAELRAEVHATATPPMRDELSAERENFRERALEGLRTLREDHLNLQGDIRADKQEQRAEVRAELDAAETPEERQAILEAARAEYAQLREVALEKRAEFRERARTIRSDIQQQRAELRVRVQTEAATRAKGHLELILVRIGTALETFATALERIHNKIAALTAEGVDTTQASEAAGAAEVALATATDKLATARATFTLVLESEEPETLMDELKTAVRDASAAVKDVLAALRKANQELKSIIRVDASLDASVGTDE